MSSVGHWHQSNDYSFQSSSTALTALLSWGTWTTPLITGFAPTMRAYQMNRNVPPLSHIFLPTCNTFIFMHTSSCITLPLGQTTDNLEDSSLPSQVSDCSEPALPQPRAFLSCYRKGRSQGKVTVHLSLRQRMWRSWAAWALLHSQVLRFLQRTQGCCGDQSSKGATKPSREKNWVLFT